MKQRYLEVTFRNDKPFAAYLYLPRVTRPRVARTMDEGHGIYVGGDTTSISIRTTRHGHAALADEEWAPLAA